MNYLVFSPLVFAALFPIRVASVSNPEELVNIRWGTMKGIDMSHGNTLPETQLPWGFNGWAPQTELDEKYWWYKSGSSKMYGIRCTHQPSPWVGDYGNIRFMAHIVDERHADPAQFSAYEPSQSTWLPYYQKHTMLTYGTREGYLTIEVAPTEHGAIIRCKFPPLTQGRLSTGFRQTRRVAVSLDGLHDIVDVFTTGPGYTQLAVRGTTFLDQRRGKNGSHHFYMTISSGKSESFPVQKSKSNADNVGKCSSNFSGIDFCGTWCNHFWGCQKNTLPGRDGRNWFRTDYTCSCAGCNGCPPNTYTYLDIEPEDLADDVLILRIATSLISQEQAKANYNMEVNGKTFNSVSTAAKTAWHSVLARVDLAVIGPGYTDDQHKDILTQFYSNMYRAAKYPRKLYELEPQTGKPVHWSPYTGRVEQGVLSTDSGFWDSHRTLYSWLALSAPERLAEIMEGWGNAYLEGGWIPQWSMPGYGTSMTGTMSDVSLSEAIIKLPHCGTTLATRRGYCVNASLMYQASRKNAFEEGHGAIGRVCLKQYIALGYVPSNCSDAWVARSMEYWHSDYAIGNAARFLGRDVLRKINRTFENDAEILSKRSQGWVNLLDPETGFFRSRQADGTFVPDFDEFAWGPLTGYTEGGPWQYRVEVPYDPKGLNSALKAMGLNGCDIIQQANTMPSTVHLGGYKYQIHEMHEMFINCWSQWGLNNQPGWSLQHMQVGFDTSITGKCASQAQKWLRQSNSLLKSGSDMYPGDEDNGSMGAWFLFNMLGIYPLSPASGNYLVGSPMFAEVSVVLPRFCTLTIKAISQSPTHVYVQSLAWNGRPVKGVDLKYSELMAGGTLEFVMGPTPFGQQGTSRWAGPNFSVAVAALSSMFSIVAILCFVYQRRRANRSAKAAMGALHGK